MNPLLLVDSYKIHHTRMYPENMTKLYSNFTPRKSRIHGIESVVTFGLQHFIKEYLIKKFNEDFFCWALNESSQDFGLQGWKNNIKEREEKGVHHRYAWDKQQIINEYKRHNQVDIKHIEGLWNLGYLPIEIKALDEGTLCPIGVPMLTITNTHPDFGWLVNYLETLISCMLWQPITSATIAYEYKKILNKYALETTGNTEGVQWQGHDFSMRGMSSVETAILSGMGHLLSFAGTDTIPAIYTLESSYKATGLIGASVPATEHSVMCMGQKESEIETFKRLMELYPSGILSVVSDTWDLWKVLTEYLPQLKEEILNRNGKLVVRPDSGDPVDIICGTYHELSPKQSLSDGNGEFAKKHVHETKGVIELLWDIFGGTTNAQGYKVLDSHIGAIYGDSITRERAIDICERLKAKGFASTNIVLGIGSYTYQYNTRDTFGFAMKATYGEISQHSSQCVEADCTCDGAYCEKTVEAREIFKDPITDDGTKKSKKGLLRVVQHEQLEVIDQQTWKGENSSLLITVFKDGKLIKETTLDEIIERLNKTL